MSEFQVKKYTPAEKSRQIFFEAALFITVADILSTAALYYEEKYAFSAAIALGIIGAVLGVGLTCYEGYKVATSGKTVYISQPKDHDN